MSTKHLKPGRVCNIRINPQDCMAICDVIEALKIDTKYMTFDNAVRITLSSLLETARSHGLIPRRDGFEYSDLMAKFKLKPRDVGAKLIFTSLVDGANIKPLATDKEREKRQRRFEELKVLYSDELNHPKPLVGTPEWQEWESLCAEFLEL